MASDWVGRVQEIFITAEQEGWCSPGVLNPSYKMTIRDTEDIYVAVVWSEFWEQAWPKVCEAHTHTRTERVLVHSPHVACTHHTLPACVTQAEEYFTKKRQEDHIRQRERDRQERLRLRRQRHKFTEGSVFGESDTDAEASVGGEDSLAALARGEFKGAEGLVGGSHGSGRWGADSSSTDRSRSASNASSADTTLDDDSTESESDDSDEELPPDPFWRQTKGGVWRMLAAFKDPYVRAVGGNVPASTRDRVSRGTLRVRPCVCPVLCDKQIRNDRAQECERLVPRMPMQGRLRQRTGVRTTSARLCMQAHMPHRQVLRRQRGAVQLA